MFYRMALAFFTAMIGFLLIALPFATVGAVDGYRLCAVRKGVCKCQKIGDQAGVLRIMDDKICARGIEPKNLPVALPTVAAPSPSSPRPDLKPLPDKIKITKPPAKFGLFNIKMPKMPDLPKIPALPKLPKFGAAPAPRTAASGVKYRLCAVRKGTCKCQKVGDAAGVLTEMEHARCIPDTPREEQIITATPPAADQKIAQDITEEKIAAEQVNKEKAKQDKIKIEDLQKQLARAGYDPGPADGSPGPKTRSAIKSFQKKTGLKADGMASPSLLAALREAPTVKLAKSKPAPKLVAPVVAKARAAVVARAPVVAPAPASTPNPVLAPIPVLAPAGVRATAAAKAMKPTPSPVKAKAKVQARLKKPVSANSRVIAVQEKLNTLGYDVGEADGKLSEKTTTAINDFQQSVGIPVDGKVTKRLLLHLNDLAPDEVSEPIFANKTPAAPENPNTQKPATQRAAVASPEKLPAKKLLTAAKSSITKRPAAKALIAPRTVERRSYSITAPKSTTFSNPLAGLLGSLKADTARPTSMDGFRNCALRKGHCLCQKIGHQPGVWTTMDDSVCVRRPVSETSTKNEPVTGTTGPKQKTTDTTAPTALQRVEAKQLTTAAKAAKPKIPSTLVDTISKILAPQKSATNPAKH